MDIQKVIDLIKAICTRVQDLEGYLNKTKLIKLLYIIDVEYYRKYKKTYFGFKWIFYDYGPWTYEYNEICNQLESSPDFKITEKAIPQNIHFIECVADKKDFSDIFENPEDSLFFRDIVNEWGLKDLNELLNYVYFYTEPMFNANRSEDLDFSKIDKLEEIPKFKLQRSSISSKEIKSLRLKLKEEFAKKKIEELKQTVNPNYDELYWNELEKMEFDNEY